MVFMSNSSKKLAALDDMDLDKLFTLCKLGIEGDFSREEKLIILSKQPEDKLKKMMAKL